jgi:PHD/YefM family antitoxin component YafN of YafNO toxin-antitoxin module
MKTKTTPPEVSEFAERVHEFLARMREREEPMVLSVDGEPALVVLDLRLYNFFAETTGRELVELLEGRIKAIDSGEEKGIPAEEAFRNIRRRVKHCTIGQ